VVLALAVLAVPAGALAAAPANDNFANREVLSGSLPIEVMGSNTEATKEQGEFISPFGAGHSIWFEWEATATGWVTIGSCEGRFTAIVGVFTGTALNSLTPAASGNSEEGPGCYGGRQYTFKAASGTKYVIGVDGNAFHLPEAPVPVTEGEAVLRIEAPPPPPNDDFANPADLGAAGQIYEFEPAVDRFYFAHLQGYNWTATKQAGEPDHEGDRGGASVWYEWTAPASGLVHLSVCCVADPILGLYTGSAVDALTPVPMNTETWPGKQAQVSEGVTYMIAVDGGFDQGTGEAAQTSFGVSTSMSLPALPKQDESHAVSIVGSLPPTPDLVPPDTSLSKTVLRRKPPIFVFHFGSSETGSTFRCSVDSKPTKPCGSLRTFKRPMPGRHRLRVFAVDEAGNVDPSPAVGRFSFQPRHRHRG
jgi:hypothetical protein